MQRLSEFQYDAIVAAIHRKPFDRKCFDSAVAAIHFKSGICPDGFKPLDLPRTLAEWRADPAASMAIVERHRSAAIAAWRLYWSMMTDATHPKD